MIEIIWTTQRKWDNWWWNLQTYTNRPGCPLQNCLFLYISVTSTTPGTCLGGVCTRIACDVMSYIQFNYNQWIKNCFFFLEYWRCLENNVELSLYLTPNGHLAKHDLYTIEEIVTDNYDLGTANGPSFTGWYCFNAWRCNWHRWIQTYVL